MHYSELNPEHFLIKEGVYCGRPSLLITPNNSDKGWTKDNLCYRSLIIDKESNKVLSSGFPKYGNYGQLTECYPCPTQFNDWSIQEKLDGSLICLDYENEQIGIRTRGAFSYIHQVNSYEFEKLFELYPKAVNLVKLNRGFTFLFELLAVDNQIVIKHDKTDFVFIGAINKETLCSVAPQELDVWAATYDLRRPQIYTFESIEEVTKTVKYWRGQEGVVIQYNGGQNRVKLKSDHYCLLHSALNDLVSIDNVIDLFIKGGKPECAIDLWTYIKDTIDYEVAEHCAADIQKVCAAYQKTLKKMEVVRHFIDGIRTGFTRKEQAHDISRNYSDWRKTYAFCLLDNRPLDDKILAKLIKEHA